MSVALEPAAGGPTAEVDVAAALAVAVDALGGTERPGQVRMAEAVAEAMGTGDHLLVQAGTGTGKSLAYLVPAILHGERVVIATATLALQAQLVERDLPRLCDALEEVLGRRPTYAVMKGRGNYACLHRIRGGVPDEQGALVELPATSPMGREVLRVRRWVEKSATGDRDELVPGVSDRAWAQVAVSARECLGADRCPEAAECFAERSRWQARRSDLVVTNHALLAIDALHNRTVLPPHDVVIVDEGHELVSRVTGAATAELSGALVSRAARFARSVVGGELADRLDVAGVDLGLAVDDVPVGRLDRLPERLQIALEATRDAARASASAVIVAASRDGGGSWAEGEDSDAMVGDAGLAPAAHLRRVSALVGQVLDVASRLVPPDSDDVLWCEDRERAGRQLRVAPLSVAALLGAKVFADRTVIMTSATLAVGGTFDQVAQSVGLAGRGLPGGAAGAGSDPVPSADGSDPGSAADGSDPVSSADADRPDPVLRTWRWSGLDVGSPFDYPRQAILYVARGLPTPGREGPSRELLDELVCLVGAAGGRTLGLFSSRRAAEVAAAHLRDHVDTPVLCQGDDSLPELGRRFRDDPATSLVGTLSLWQGIDVPGPTCQLVVIDRIPFPRPDDPLASARQRAIDREGGNGFLAVAASHAALLLAQGAGRLIRCTDDRGVVAVLDPRLATARYRDYLLRSLPPMWLTTDRGVAVGALRRLARTVSG